MTHPTRERLLDLALGALVDREEERVRAHVDGCECCRVDLRALVEEQELLKGHFARAEGALEGVEGLERRVIAAVRAEGRARRAPARRRRLRRVALAGAAVGLAAVGLAIGYEALRDRRTPKQVMLDQVRLSERRALGLEEAAR